VRAGEWAVRPIETRILGDRRVKVPIIGEIDGGKPVSNWKALTTGERKVLILQGDASALNIPENTVDYVVTDPPYYDSVQYIVFSENPVSVHILGLKSLKHDAILVLRPKTVRGKSRKWAKPRKIDTTDSYSFCRDCGTALGWFLASDIDEKSMRREWQHLLGQNCHRFKGQGIEEILIDFGR